MLTRRKEEDYQDQLSREWNSELLFHSEEERKEFFAKWEASIKARREKGKNEAS